jgi:hypothetical protein
MNVHRIPNDFDDIHGGKRCYSFTLSWTPDETIGINYACYKHINLLLESLYKRKPHQNPLGTFIDLSIHTDRQREATLFYTKLL